MSDTLSPHPLSCIAIVDDDQALRESLAWLLESVGLATQAYADGETFLATRATTVDAVLLDVRMPGLSGLQVHQQLRDEGITLPVIIMTGHGDVPMAITALKGGAFDFIEKPFNPQQLIDTVQQALNLHQRERLAQSQLAALQARYQSLRPKEQQIIIHVAEGMTSREIAAHIGVSGKTVEVYRLRAMKTMEADNLAQLVRQAIALELVACLPDPASNLSER